MPARNPHLPSLVAGLALVAIGTLFVLTSTDVVHVGLTGTVSAFLAALGAVVVASGVARTRADDR